MLPTTNLVTKHALNVMAEHVPDLASHIEKIKNAARRHTYFPDGSLLIEGENCCEGLKDFIFRHALGVAGVWQPNGYRGLAEFGGKVCVVWYTNDYRESLGEDDLQIRSPNEVGWSKPPIYRLDDLLISVVFTRKTSDEVRRRFARYVGEWSAQVVQKGTFNDGPARLLSPHVEFRGKLAQFQIDVSQSGQDTLNWLVLSVLNFGYTVSAVANLVFAHEENIVQLIEGVGGTLEGVFGKATSVSVAPEGELDAPNQSTRGANEN